MRLALALLGTIAALGCRGGEPAPRIDPAERAKIQATARELEARAAAAEPAISERIKSLAAEVGGEVAGFDHRLKTLASLERKIRNRVRVEPGKTIDNPDIVDALRYTIVVEPDRYVAAIRRVLAAFEADGHEVVRVKNYWPPGDNYSGVNTVLRYHSLQWEIQFHTPQSIEVRDAWHPAYEQLREADTPIERRRWLYALMAVPWDQVEIPDGVDRLGALHPRDEIRRYPPP